MLSPKARKRDQKIKKQFSADFPFFLPTRGIKIGSKWPYPVFKQAVMQSETRAKFWREVRKGNSLFIVKYLKNIYSNYGFRTTKQIINNGKTIIINETCSRITILPEKITAKIIPRRETWDDVKNKRRREERCSVGKTQSTK